MDSDRRRVLVKLVQYAVGISALAWIVSGTDWSRVLDLLAGVSPFVLAVVLAVTAGEFASRFFIWHALLNARERSEFEAAVNVDLVIRFVNQLFPSRLSGRSVAPLVVRHYTGFSWSDAVAVAGVHTGIHALLYGTVAAVGLLLSFPQLSLGLAVVIGLSTALYVVAGTSVMLAGRRLHVLDALLARLVAVASRTPRVGERAAGLLDAAPDFTADSAAAFRQLTNDPVVWVLYTAGWAGKLMAFPGVRVLLLLEGLGAGFEPAVLLPFFLVMAYSVTLLPLTPGGIGVAEASAVLVFTALGVPVEVIVPVVLIDRFLGVYLAALFGGIPMLRLDLSDLTAE